MLHGLLHSSSTTRRVRAAASEARLSARATPQRHAARCKGTTSDLAWSCMPEGWRQSLVQSSRQRCVCEPRRRQQKRRQEQQPRPPHHRQQTRRRVRGKEWAGLRYPQRPRSATEQLRALAPPSVCRIECTRTVIPLYRFCCCAALTRPSLEIVSMSHVHHVLAEVAASPLLER